MTRTKERAAGGGFRVDFKRVVTDLYGEPVDMIDPDMNIGRRALPVLAKKFGVGPAAIIDALGAAGAKQPMTLGFLAITGLGKATGGDDRVSGEDAFKYFRLGLKVVEAEKSGMPASLEPEEVVLLKKRIAMMFQDPAIVGRAYEMLNTPEPPAA